MGEAVPARPQVLKMEAVRGGIGHGTAFSRSDIVK